MTETVRDTVRVELGQRSYDILVGADLLVEAGRYIAGVIGRKRQLVIVTDENVAAKGHLAVLQQALVDEGLSCNGAAIVLSPGEHTKNFDSFKNLLERLLGRGIDRKTVLVAFGGGVIGDLTGFSAACALRGLDFIQIPTTLLSQVDSSVGGKTGLNSQHGKNLIGAFHQPRLVLADISVLKSLDQRQLRSGYAEVVKYGLINDPAFFGWLERHGHEVIEGDEKARRQAVTTSCRAKAEIVGADERESGQRALLNLGHTFGHAFEAACGYTELLLHGEAVALGMALAFELSARLGLCPAADALRVQAHLYNLGLPVRPEAVPAMPWEPDQLLVHMGHDKKVSDGRITFVLARGIGKALLTSEVDSADVLRLLAG